MFRTLTAIVASLLILPWQASLAANTDAHEELLSDTTIPVGAFRSQPERLQKELQRHRTLADAGGWPDVPEGPTIRPGAEDPRLAVLVRRLAISGDLPASDASAPRSNYSESLQDAVRRFQLRHGLEDDGLVGRKTLRALNVSIEQRINQIRVNLERARRPFDSHDNDLVLVNVAAFRLFVIRGGKTIWTTRIIVGESEKETPEFRSTMKHVVFNPTWTVPYSIASEEMLPKIKEDPSFFEKGKYHVLDRDGNRVEPSSVNWGAIDIKSFPFTLVQQPGPANQLGQIKFMLPNEYSVCIHDTPARFLFARAARAFSHGCIRVDEPLGLAEVLLGSDGWTRERIDSQIDSKATRTVVLSEPVPVLVLYWTVEVDDLGVIYFYDDIYGRDAALLRELNKASESDGPH